MVVKPTFASGFAHCCSIKITNIEYDRTTNKPVSVTYANGEGFFFESDYNKADKTYYSQVTTYSGKIKEVWYDKDGETKRVDVNGRTIKKLDKDGRNFKITDEKGNVTQKFYDEWDNLLKVVFADGSVESYEYEHKFHKMIRFVDAYVTSYEYDDFGNLLKIIDALGTADERVTSFAYDGDFHLGIWLR